MFFFGVKKACSLEWTIATKVMITLSKSHSRMTYTKMLLVIMSLSNYDYDTLVHRTHHITHAVKQIITLWDQLARWWWSSHQLNSLVSSNQMVVQRENNSFKMLKGTKTKCELKVILSETKTIITNINTKPMEFHDNKNHEIKK